MKAEEEEHWGIGAWSLTGIGQWRPSLVGLNWFPVKGETQLAGLGLDKGRVLSSA